MAEVKTIKDSTSEYTVSVEVTAGEYEKQFDDELSKIAKTVKLDGFRQGKVPHSVIKKKFESQCHQKSISYLIDYHSNKISSEKKFDLVDSPSAKLLDTPSKEKNLSFEVTYNIMPDIDIALIDKINLEVPSVEINDKDIDKVIDNIRKQNSEWSDSSKEAADGNKIVVDYEGKINSKDFKNNKQSDFSFVINDTIKGDSATVSLFKEFSKECIGKKVNDTVEVTHKMPNDFPDKELAGNTVIYSIKIKKILIGKLPALDKDFFSNLGISTEDESVFRDSVKTHMNFELKDKLVSKKYSLVNEKLIDAFEFDLPNSLVAKHEAELKQQYASFKQANDDVDDKIKDIAIKRVKLNIIYIKLAKEIKTSISDQEAIDFCNDQSPAFRQFYGEKLKKDKSTTLLDVKNKMVENGIVESVINKSNVKTLSMSFSEIMDD
jgi:trigger factor